MAFCMQCGTKLEEGTRFCFACGHPTGAAQPQASVPAPAQAPAPAQPAANPSMRTVKEMMEAANKYQLVNLNVYELAFEEIVKMLRPDEEVLCAFTGSSATRANNSMLWFVGVAITNQRLLIGGQIKGMLKVSYTAQSFNVENINAISQTYSMIGGDLIIDTLGDDIRIGESSRETVNKIIVDVEAALYAIKNAKKAAMNPVQQVSAADELKKFKELMDMGIITPEEFAAKKKQLLGL